MILCLASMYQRAGVLVCSSAGLCLLVPPSFPGSSSFPFKVHYLLSRDCGHVVFPSRSAAATLQEWQSPRSSRHCCQPKSFQMREKIRPKGEQHETRGKWWAKYKGRKFPDLQRKKIFKVSKESFAEQTKWQIPGWQSLILRSIWRRLRIYLLFQDIHGGRYFWCVWNRTRFEMYLNNVE